MLLFFFKVPSAPKLRGSQGELPGGSSFRPTTYTVRPEHPGLKKEVGQAPEGQTMWPAVPLRKELGGSGAASEWS